MIIRNGDKEERALAEIGREGHRERMRQAYLCGDMENAPAHNLLELFLSIIIPRKDVKQLSYDLINKFGSLEAVFSASPYELMTVKGIGESTAIALSLVDKFYTKINVDKNNSIHRFKSMDECYDFCRNLLKNEKNEKVYIITLTSLLSVINCYKVGEGSVLSSNVDMKSILTYTIKDNAAYVLITHNHPNGSPHPSGEDASFTVKLKDMLETINVKLFDHIIVSGEDAISLKHSSDYRLNL